MNQRATVPAIELHRQVMDAADGISEIAADLDVLLNGTHLEAGIYAQVIFSVKTIKRAAQALETAGQILQLTNK